MSIGEFARRSRLSPKALRLYEELGLLSPARVDDLSGYRYYESAQLEQARLIATLRHVGVPLATVKEWLALDPAEIAERVRAFWREAEAHHAAQRQLAAVLVDRLTGRSTVMYEVATREMPRRRLLCLKRNVSEAGGWALGKEFIGIVRDLRLPRLAGREAGRGAYAHMMVLAAGGRDQHEHGISRAAVGDHLRSAAGPGVRLDTTRNR